MAEQTNLKDLISQKVQVRYETEIDGKMKTSWYSAVLIQLFDGELAEVTFDSFEVDGNATVEVAQKNVKPPRKPRNNGEKKAAIPAAPATKSYADLLKPPPPPKVEVAATTAAGGVVPPRAPKPVAGAFDYEKFTAYVKDIVPEHAKDLVRPTDEELERIKTTAFTNHFSERAAERYATNLQELKRSLMTNQDAFLFHETRYMFYLPTKIEIDRQDGWDVKIAYNKTDSFEGSYITFTKDFTKVCEVHDKEAGERKASRVPAVNIVELEATTKSHPTRTLVERARGAIAHWNEYVARQSKKDSELRSIYFTDDSVPLLSAAFESASELKTVSLISTTTTCILNEDMSCTITCFKNRMRYAQWIEKIRSEEARKNALVHQRSKSDGEKKPRANNPHHRGGSDGDAGKRTNNNTNNNKGGNGNGKGKGDKKKKKDE